MNPFSGLYYIRNNKGRTAVIAITCILTVAVYYFGNLVYGNFACWDEILELGDRYVVGSAMGIDEDFKDYNHFMEVINANPDVHYVTPGQSIDGSVEWKTTMGFEQGSFELCFASKESMEEMLQVMGLEADLTDLGPGDAILSRRQAENLGISIGDNLGDSELCGYMEDITLKGYFDNYNGFGSFYISPYGETQRGNFYLYSDTMTTDELKAYCRDIIGDGNVTIYYEPFSGLEESFSGFIAIFYAIAFIIGLVLMICANTVIAGHFIKRQYEFSIYRAIGISKNKIRTKIASEIGIVFVICMFIGWLLMLLITFVMNQMVYYPAGMFQVYSCDMGLIGYILCNLMIMIPTIIIQSKKMVKSDITNY